MVQNVTDNEKGDIQRQLINARKTRDLCTKVGYLSIRGFIITIKKNMINNFTIIIEDVMRAERINGPSVQALKGKTIRTKPSPVMTDYVAVPHAIFEENQIFTLSVDVMFVNRIPFLTSIIRHLKFTTAETFHNCITSQLINVSPM